MIEYVILGLLMGFLTATSGCIKDTSWEPFSIRKYFRSIYIGGVGGMVCYMFFPDRIHPILIMSFSFLIERLMIEIWKAFLRTPQIPSKFKDENKDTKWIIRKLKGEL